MKTKALLLAGLMAASSLASLQAQTVYSVNSVGYVQVTLVPGFNLIANPLATPNNTVAELFPTPPGNSAAFKFNPSTGFFDTQNYAFGFWLGDALTLSPGEGLFFRNGGATNYNITFMGEVPQGELITPLPAGFSIVSSQVPQTGKMQTDLGYTPAANDAVFKFDTTTQNYKRFNFVFGFWLDGESVNEPVINAGEAVFLKKSASGTWTRTFTTSPQPQ
jgi:hypothetical protein